MSDAMLARLFRGAAMRREAAISALERAVACMTEGDMDALVGPHLDLGERGVELSSDAYADDGVRHRDFVTIESQALRRRFEALQRHVTAASSGRYELAFGRRPVLSIVVPTDLAGSVVVRGRSLVHHELPA